MATKTERLRAANTHFGFAANVLAFLTANWGLALSAAIALVAGLTKVFFDLVTNPHVQVIIRAFLWSLWSYIGISLLYKVDKGLATRPLVDYPHSLVLENITLAYDPDSEDAALQILVVMRNVANGPVMFQIQEFRIILEGRTIPDSPVLQMVIPRLGNKGVASGTFKRDAVKDRSSGTMDLIVHYGDPEGEPTRRFRAKANLFVRLGLQPAIGNHITFEEDVAL